MKHKRLLTALAVLVVLFLVAFAPLPQGPQRFRQIITQTLLVQNDATFQGAVSLDGDIAVGDDLAITGDLKVGNGTPTVTQDGEDAYVEGQFEVDGEAQFDGAIDANSTADFAGNITDSNSAVTFADNVAVTGAADAIQLTVTGYTTQTNVLQTWEASGGSDVGTMSNAGLLTLAGGLTTSNGNVTVADKAIVTAQTALTVTNAAAFTPTGTYQPIQAGSNVTPTITAGSAGQLLVLVNVSAFTIVIQDTGNQVLSGSASLGQYDTLTLWADGTRWLQIATSNN